MFSRILRLADALPPYLSYAAWVFFAGFSIALGAQLAGYDQLEVFALKNAMRSSVRTRLLLIAVATAIFWSALWLADGLRAKGETRRARMQRFAFRIAPGVVACALPFLYNWEAFTGRPLLRALASLVFGLIFERTVSLALSTLACPKSALWQRASRWLPWVMLTLIISAFCLFFVRYTTLHHYRLQTRSYDLAIFDNLMWNLMRGEWFFSSPALGRAGSHLERHMNLMAHFFVPFYALSQKADTLLIIQTVVCGLAALPIFLLAQKHLRSAWLALSVALAYALYPALHGPLFFDFHFLTLAPFFVAWTLYTFEAGKRYLFLLCWSAALLLREDIGAGLAFIFLFYSLKNIRHREAIALTVLSALYFLVAKFIAIPLSGSGAMSYSFVYDGLKPRGEVGFVGVVRTLVSNPLFAASFLLTEGRLVYVLSMLGPLLFLPLRVPRGWLLLIYPAFVTLLPTDINPATIHLGFHYTAYWTPYVFAGAIHAIGWCKTPTGRTAAVLGILFASLAFSYQEGALFRPPYFNAGFNKVQFSASAQDHHNHYDLYQLIQKIPKSASVAVTEMEAAHVSNRKYCFTMRYGHDNADYLLADLFELQHSASGNVVLRALRTGHYGFVDRRGKFVLWARGYSHARDSEGLHHLTSR